MLVFLVLVSEPLVAIILINLNKKVITLRWL